MAEGENTQGGGWWSSWINAAKEKTEKAFEMVSSDLAEFTTTMQSDTKKVVEKTKETLQAAEGSDKKDGDRMKQSFYSLMEGITKALTVEPEDTSPPRTSAPQPEAPGLFDRAKARLRAIQVDTGTYLHEPSGAPNLYADWLKTFDIEAYKGQISELLVTMVEVRSLYTSLVPSEVSHQDFWRRYFYKVHQLEVDEARKQALMQRAERAQTHKEDSISWDEEGWDSGSEDAPSPKQTANPTEGTASRLQPSDHANSTADIPPVQSEQLDAAIHKTLAEASPVPNKDSSPNNKINDRLKETVKETGKSEEQTDEQTKGPNETEKHISEEVVNSTVVKTVTSEESEKHTQASATSSNKDKMERQMTPEAQGANVEKTEKAVDSKQDVIEKTGETKTELGTRSEPQQLGSEVVTEALIETESAKTQQQGSEVVTKTQVGVGVLDDTAAGGEAGEVDLKTKVKGDMVVVGDRISPSSESSANKESGDDWEQDFDDIPVTAEDLQAAHELANKLNMSAAEYNTLTGGEEDDWENWE